MAGSIAVLPDNWTYVKRRTRLEEEATLIVGDFENEMKISKPREKIESRIFILGGNPFKIDVYPNGENEESKNHVSIFLANDSNTDVNVSAEFEICNSEKDEWEKGTVKQNERVGWSKFMEHDAMADLLVNGSLIVKVKVKMENKDFVVMGKDEKKGDSKSAEEIVAIHINTIYENMMNPDFMLICEGGNIPCHRNFLMSASSMFAGMMKSGMKEAEQGKTDLKCSFTVGKELVRFIYTGKVEEEILVENVVEFLELGERLGMDILKMFLRIKC